MSRSWRDWKCRVKKSGYRAFKTDEERLANRPDRVIPEQWSSLVAMWNLEKSQVPDFIFLPSFYTIYTLQFLLMILFKICHV